nr:DNA/RNA helicase domain-containing protein [Clostridium pasteurianum]
MKDIISNDSLYKLDPYKKLTEEQEKLKEHIFKFCYNHLKDEHAIFLINGAAGTGKSLLLSSIFNNLQNISRSDSSNALYDTNNYLLVNHPEMLKLYKEIAGKAPNLLKKNFERPTTFINRMAKNNTRADIVLIDEAHLLLTKKDPYNHFNQDNQLEEIIKHSHIVILVFDENQVLKFKSYWKNEKYIVF